MRRLSNSIAVWLLLLAVSAVQAKSVNDSKKKAVVGKKDYGEAVFLTPYIESGNIEKARERSRTGSFPGAPELLSYSGFFTVSKKYNNNLFFWFIPALNKDKDAPILLWFQGGPGLSTLFGFFVEHGPYVLNANMTANMRDYNWAQNFQVIYVDNPVGSGFSFTTTEGGYVINQVDVAEDMYNFMQQFFKVFYEYKKNDFYVIGESYGGKYAASLAYRIHTEGNSSGINLKGVAISNGWCDPETMLDYGTFLYNIGMVDEMQAEEMKEQSNRIVDDIKKQKWMEALEGYTQLIAHYRTLPPTTSLWANFTGLGNFAYNFLWNQVTDDYSYYTRYIQLPEFRKALNVGNLTFQDGRKAQKALLPDIMQSVKPQIAVLMDNYKVLIFNGQLDVIQPYTSTVNFIKSIDWKYKNQYRTAERKKWTIVVEGDNKYVGYYHQVNDFIEVMVRDAGHILSTDQPMLAQDLITRFVNNVPLS